MIRKRLPRCSSDAIAEPSPSDSSGGDQRRNLSVKPTLSPVCPQSGVRQTTRLIETASKSLDFEVILTCFKQRRGRDSNPRYGCPYTGFRVREPVKGGETRLKSGRVS